MPFSWADALKIGASFAVGGPVGGSLAIAQTASSLEDEKRAKAAQSAQGVGKNRFAVPSPGPSQLTQGLGLAGALHSVKQGLSKPPNPDETFSNPTRFA